MQIRVAVVEFFANDFDVARVIVIVNGIRFLLPNDTAVDDIAVLRETDLDRAPFLRVR